MGIYSKERFLITNMLAEEHAGYEEEHLPDEARATAERAHIPIGSAMHLAAKHPRWTWEFLGETIYVYTLRILKMMGNDSMGSKINREGFVEMELEMPLGEKGEDWNTISIAHWWVMMKENFLLHVLVSPIEILEILMGWNHEIRHPRQN